MVAGCIVPIAIKPQHIFAIQIIITFICNCGATGFVELTDVENISQDKAIAKAGLEYIKNRLCCNIDKLPMFSVVKKQLKKYEYKVVCKNCGAFFDDEVDLTPAQRRLE